MVLCDKGYNFLSYVLSLLVNDVSLSENLTSERSFTTSGAAG